MKSLAFATLLLTALSSHASVIKVMTFSRTTFDSVYVEDGITANAHGWIDSFVDPGTAHIDAYSTGYASREGIDFTVSGHTFNAISVDVRPFGSQYCSGDYPDMEGDEFGDLCPYDDPMPYIWAEGYLGNALIIALGIHRFASQAYFTWDLSAFAGIDRLRIRSRSSDMLGLPGVCNQGNGCGHFNIDNVTLDVPEPSAIVLFVGGLLGLWSAHRSVDREERPVWGCLGGSGVAL